MKFINRATARASIAGELLAFLWQRKLWWLMPLVLTLVLFGAFLVFAHASSIAPFIYTLF